MIGELNKRITLYRREAVDNGRGGFTYDFDKVGSYWAAVMPMDQTEISKYREVSVQTNARIVMRYNPDEFKRPKAGDRVMMAFNTFDIVGVVDSLNNGDYIELLAVTT
jgi:SPP1 family predicted phage head-tail adaptor